MGQQSLIYSFVARGTVILAEYTEFTGNFTGIAAQCLQKLPASNNKFTYNCDGHTFNYLVEDGFSKHRRLRSVCSFLLLKLFGFKYMCPILIDVYYRYLEDCGELSRLFVCLFVWWNQILVDCGFPSLIRFWSNRLFLWIGFEFQSDVDYVLLN